MTLPIFLIFFGIGLSGVLTLIIAGIFARTRLSVIVWGVIGSLLIAFQILAFIAMEAISGGAWSGTGSSGVPFWMALGGVAVVIIYFVISLSRLDD